MGYSTHLGSKGTEVSILGKAGAVEGQGNLIGAGVQSRMRANFLFFEYQVKGFIVVPGQ